MIAILEYGTGNVSSIKNMLKKIGVESIITNDLDTVQKATKFILPGVGHFDYCMSQLRKAPFFSLVEQRVKEEKVPVLGVCAGSQMLMEKSEEGTAAGLGWIKGEVIKFKQDKLPQGYKIPHMGWTDVKPLNNNFLYEGIDEPRFYFTHSYHIVPEDKTHVTALAEYGYDITASVQSGNIMGVQFHPEKSHQFGMKLYENFAKY
jgi:glutamine amidotransferase